MRVAKCDECGQIAEQATDKNTGNDVMPSGWFMAQWHVQPQGIFSKTRLKQSRPCDLCPDCALKIEKLFEQVISGQKSTTEGQST